MQANATLKNDRQATVDQVRAFIRLMTEHGQRILNAKIENGYMKINYMTRGGHFVQVQYDSHGNEMNRHYFKDWDAENAEPVNPINFQE